MPRGHDGAEGAAAQGTYLLELLLVPRHVDVRDAELLHPRGARGAVTHGERELLLGLAAVAAAVLLAVVFLVIAVLGGLGLGEVLQGKGEGPGVEDGRATGCNCRGTERRKEKEF